MTDSTLPERARVVVVGGGVIGCSIAYHLTRAGVRDVVLLERKELTAGTTWHAAGLITSAGMPTETFLWMSRYTADLLPQLTEETGQDTGFRRIGHLHLACTPQRVETVTREAAFAKAHGVPIELVGPEEVARHWPAAKVDDILTAAWVPDEGRANPADVTQAYAKGARMGGAQIVEGVTVTGFATAGGRVTGVETDRGSIETETVVIAAGMWGRQLGALAGVTVPLQAAEHYYLLTDTVEWAHPDLPVVEDPDRYGYYREEAGGILVGLFEPKAAPWSLDRDPAGPRVRRASARLGPDGRIPVGCDGPVPLAARRRHPPVLLRAGELYPRHRTAAGRGTRAPRVLHRVRAQLARHPAVRWRRLVHDRSGSSTANRRWTSRA